MCRYFEFKKGFCGSQSFGIPWMYYISVDSIIIEFEQESCGSHATSIVHSYVCIKSVKLIMFIWKPTLAIFRVTKNSYVSFQMNIINLTDFIHDQNQIINCNHLSLLMTINSKNLNFGTISELIYRRKTKNPWILLEYQAIWWKNYNFYQLFIEIF